MTRWKASPPECEVTDIGAGGDVPGFYRIIGPTEMAVEATANLLMEKLAKNFDLNLGGVTQRVTGKYGVALYYVRKGSSWGKKPLANMPRPKPNDPPAMPGSVAVHMASRKGLRGRLAAALTPPPSPAPAPVGKPAGKAVAPSVTPQRVERVSLDRLGPHPVVRFTAPKPAGRPVAAKAGKTPAPKPLREVVPKSGKPAQRPIAAKRPAAPKAMRAAAARMVPASTRPIAPKRSQAR